MKKKTRQSEFRRLYGYSIPEMEKILKISSTLIYRLHYTGKLKAELKKKIRER